MLYSGDLGFGKTEIFFSRGLDRANQLELPRQIRFLAQRLFVDLPGKKRKNVLQVG
jgi:hypothetical protein